MKNLRHVIVLAKEDFLSAYAGSVLGALWGVLYPVITVLLYVFVFKIILNMGSGDGTPYVLWMVSALIPYIFISDGICGAASVYLDYSYMVRKLPMYLCRLPVSRVLSRFFAHAVFIMLLLVLRAALGCGFFGGLFELTYYLIAEIAFVFAVGYLFSVLCVFFRDIRSALPALVQLGYWVTPVFWSLSDFGGADALRIINPAVYIIEGFRAAVCGGPGPQLWYTVWFWIFTAAAAAAGMIVFRKIGGTIADYI